MAYPYDDRYREHRGERPHGREDRGLIERAGDEVRSWFGDDDAERRRRLDEERHRHERVADSRWDQGDDRYRQERWRTEADRPQSDRSRNDYERSDARSYTDTGYGVPSAGYGVPYAGGRQTNDERWRGNDEARDFGSDRARADRSWGPATWSQGDRWRREAGSHGEHWSARGSNWGAWPREQGMSSSSRPHGGSRGFYEDERGHLHQFPHTPESSFSGRGPKGYRRSDERIREDICERLTEDWQVDASEIEIVVNNGEVTLTGAVGSRHEKRKAEDLAEAVTGVHEVHNSIRVGSGDQQRDYERPRATGMSNDPTTPTSIAPGTRK